MSNWRPIETAPRDGTEIILCNISGSLGIGSYMPKQDSWEITDDVWWDKCSHWMPLPKPPEEDEK